MKLAWGKRVSPEFRARAIKLGRELGFDPSWLMACIAFESARTFSPSVRNPVSGATGLIQNMPQFSVGDVGFTVDQIAAMTAEEQLDKVVARYFAPFAGRIHSLADCYMAILWKRAVGQRDDFVLMEEGSKAYLQNKGLDLNKDGAITKAEATRKVAELLAEGLMPENAYDDDTQAAAPIVDADPQHRIEIPPEENTMADGPSFNLGSTLKAAAGPASLVNPLIGAGLGLAGFLVEAFAPLAREKIAKEMSRHTDSPEIAAQFADGLIGAAKNLTKMADPVQAVAAVRADPALLQQLEQKAIMKIDQMLPLFDRLAAIDQAQADRDIASADAAAARAQRDRVDLGPMLARAGIGMLWTILLGPMIMVGLQIVYSPDHSPDSAILILVSSIVGTLATAFIGMWLYRFGRQGTATNSAGTAITSTLNAR